MEGGRRRAHASTYGFHPSPVRHGAGDGDRRAASRASRFADPGEERGGARATCSARWPKANYVEDFARTGAARRAASSIRRCGAREQPLRVVLIGTDFEVRVWETLLKIPMGRLRPPIRASPAEVGAPKAARAVGAAVGKNPICFVVPCHRVVGKNGDLTGYHWGLTRKRAMLGWEAGHRSARRNAHSPAARPVERPVARIPRCPIRTHSCRAG